MAIFKSYKATTSEYKLKVTFCKNISYSSVPALLLNSFKFIFSSLFWFTDNLLFWQKNSFFWGLHWKHLNNEDHALEFDWFQVIHGLLCILCKQLLAFLSVLKDFACSRQSTSLKVTSSNETVKMLHSNYVYFLRMRLIQQWNYSWGKVFKESFSWKKNKQTQRDYMLYTV